MTLSAGMSKGYLLSLGRSRIGIIVVVVHILLFLLITTLLMDTTCWCSSLCRRADRTTRCV